MAALSALRSRQLLLDVLFIIQQIVVVLVVIIVTFFGLIGIFVFVIIFRDDVDAHGVSLHDFHLGFALGASENFAFLYFVLIDIDCNRTFGTVNQGRNLRPEVPRFTGASVLYTRNW